MGIYIQKCGIISKIIYYKMKRMFTGIITTIGKIYSKTDYIINSITEICIEIFCAEFLIDKEIGGSIAINGVCLTIVKFEKDKVWFQVMKQTLERTNLNSLINGDRVNIEGAMANKSFIDGHIVSGHIDGTATITKIVRNTDESVLVYIKIWNVDNFLKEWLVSRGSICINGTSLTLAEVYDDEFVVSLIPYTIANTIFQYVKVNDIVNIEFDQMLKRETVSNKITRGNLNTFIGTKIISHSHAMKLAIEIGEIGRIGAPPNPWVGCIIVKNDKIIGLGYHTKAGNDHAEIEAIKSVKSRDDSDKADRANKLEGSTMYVSLEPCNHHGKTPPCCKAIIENKIKNVYISVKDPDNNVNGNGIKYLQDNGLTVHTDIENERGIQSLKSYLYNREEKKPYVILKAAISIDCKIAAKNGTSKWISCDKSREDVHILRSQCQGILIGINTCLKDNPRLNVRSENYTGNQPIRIVLDSYGKLKDRTLNIFDHAISKTIIFTSNNCSNQTKALWKDMKIDYYIIENCKNGKLDIDQLHYKLASLGIMQLLVEGGSEILTNYIIQRKFNELILYQGATLIGDNGICLFNNNVGEDITAKLVLKLESTERMGLCNKIIYTNKY
jgi:diaminohydroxyphosphoribosylaminopyrimidine deaminase/5-amino-6-(5-phosphoribosylamino)uracil reductase